jgi:hypothetical protein
MALPRTVSIDRVTGPGGDVKERCSSGTAPGGGAVFGLGLVGAFVWFWQEAEGLGEHLVGVLKALVWPAFLVYEAFKALTG